MKCPKCNSENVQIQSKEYKPKFTVPILLVGAGFGTMFLGIIGTILGVIFGAIVAAIVHAVTPQSYQAVMVCQQCGFVGTDKTIAHAIPNPQFCTMDESNLMVVRKSNSIGSVCRMEIKIDDSAPFFLDNGEVKHLKLATGVHKVAYRQVNGMGKKQRNGLVDVSIDENRRLVQFDFLQYGVNVLIQ